VIRGQDPERVTPQHHIDFTSRFGDLIHRLQCMYVSSSSSGGGSGVGELDGWWWWCTVEYSSGSSC